MSSSDEGHTWKNEFVKDFGGKDIRNPYLLEVNGTLHCYYIYEGFNVE